MHNGKAWSKRDAQSRGRSLVHDFYSLKIPVEFLVLKLSEREVNVPLSSDRILSNCKVIAIAQWGVQQLGSLKAFAGSFLTKRDLKGFC